MKTSTPELIDALRILVGDIFCEDGIANLVIAEAADRLEELQTQLQEAQAYADRLVAHNDMLCLPRDLENLRSANSHFATENHVLREQLRNK
jgi:hypothetical protein